MYKIPEKYNTFNFSDLADAWKDLVAVAEPDVHADAEIRDAAHVDHPVGKQARAVGDRLFAILLLVK